MTNDYTVQKLVDRLTLKAFTSTSSSLSPQQIVDLLNDSLRAYLVPLTRTLREEWWVGKTDLVATSDADGKITIPDTVASSLRTVAWLNGGILQPLSRVEPEAAFQYLSFAGSLPTGFQLRGYTLQLLPPVPGIAVHMTAMLRPPQMVLDEQAGLIDSNAGAALTLEDAPLDWQAETPASVDLISGVSPFSTIDTFDVVSLVGDVLTLTEDPGTLPAEAWVADVGASPFANVPIELYPLLEQDVICQLFGTGLGDKRLAGAQKRKEELEKLAKAAMAPRTTGNARVIVNPSAPGMRGALGRFRG